MKKILLIIVILFIPKLEVYANSIEDALNSKYEGIVFFSDYSWYNGKVYVDGGIVTNDKYIDPLELDDKNYYINYIIRKNDLTLKYNYFKTIKSKNDKNL